MLDSLVKYDQIRYETQFSLIFIFFNCYIVMSIMILHKTDQLKLELHTYGCDFVFRNTKFSNINIPYNYVLN